MEPSEEKCGKNPPATSVTGETTVKKVSVFSSTQTTTNTKACGPWTRSTAKVLTGEMKAEN